MSCQVGNEGARDEAKHTAAFVLKAAITATIPGAGDLLSVHYDKRGAKIAIACPGEDCTELKGKVEEEAQNICASSPAPDSLKLTDSDKEALKAFGVVGIADLGGVTVKKFSYNGSKQQIIAEYIVGGGKKKEAAPAPVAGESKKKGKDTGAKKALPPPSSYDAVPEVTQALGALIGAPTAEQSGSNRPTTTSCNCRCRLT